MEIMSVLTKSDNPIETIAARLPEQDKAEFLRDLPAQDSTSFKEYVTEWHLTSIVLNSKAWLAAVADYDKCDPEPLTFEQWVATLV